MDNFEKRIQDMREALDHVEQADREAIWAGVQERMKPQARVVPFYQRRFVRVIAASMLIVLIAGAGWFAHSIFGGAQSQGVAYSPELQAMERQYQQLIEYKKKELRLENIDKDAYREVLAELEEVERQQEQYKQDWSKLPQDERNIQTLMRMYEQKIRILEILAKEIQIQKNEKDRNNEQAI